MARGDVTADVTPSGSSTIEDAAGNQLSACVSVDTAGAEKGTASNPIVVSDGGQTTVDEIADVVMASADTEYTVAIPEGARGILLRLRDTSVAWRVSNTSGVVATPGQGFPVEANSGLTIAGPSAGQTLYVAHSSASSQTLTAIHE